MSNWKEMPIVAGNAYCPTGPGGGQDNSCSPTGGEGGGGEASEHGRGEGNRITSDPPLASAVERLLKFRAVKNDVKKHGIVVKSTYVRPKILLPDRPSSVKLTYKDGKSISYQQDGGRNESRDFGSRGSLRSALQ